MRPFGYYSMMKMSGPSRKPSILLYSLLVLQLTEPHLVCGFFDPAVTPQPSETDIVTIPNQQEYHPTMSCFVCSTMDYDNPADNLCRIMRPHHQRSTPNLYQQTSSSHHYIQSTTTTTTTTTSTTTAATLNSDSFNANNPTELDSTHSSNSTISTGESSSNTSIGSGDQHGQYLNTTLAGKTAAGGQATSTLSPLVSTTSSSLAQQHHHIRQQPSGNYIRTRSCFDDENFCSIVSVVRIEFVNDNLISKFWAMERNCSKSCNTGCMLIGERVRLRVCSQCCRTPNCNMGSGATWRNHILLNVHHMIMITLAFVFITLSNLPIRTNNLVIFNVAP